MAGKMCPSCGEQTFFSTPTGRKCSKCDHKMIIPASGGRGGKGTKCSNCNQFKVFDNTCRGCGAKYR